VEYYLTEKGKQTLPIIETLRNWGLELMVQEGIKSKENNPANR